MKIGIIGAGPAGSLCAAVLSKAGADVLLFDYRGAWEKPCGGGVTYKALLRYPFLKDCLEQRRNITHMSVLSPRDARAIVTLQDPLLIYSRKVLNRILLERALAEGAEFREERVLGFERKNSHWQLKTQIASHRVDFLVGADGVNSAVRKKLGDRFPLEDLMMTYGYRVFVEGENTIEIKFFPKFPGYLWVFARPDNISFGICGKLSRINPDVLKQYLHQSSRNLGFGCLASPVSTDAFGVSDYEFRDPPVQGVSAETRKPSQVSISQTSGYPRVELYSALIPSLRAASLRRNRILGDGWALLGDAAGFADPITCEGIYYALRSGELLANALVESKPNSYPTACTEDFVEDFVHAASLFERFYTGNFLGSDFITRMVQTISRSESLRSVMSSFISGRQGYKSLRRELLRKSPRILCQLTFSPLR